MAITNTRLSTINPTTVFTAVGQQAITVLYLCNTTGSTVTTNVYVNNGGASDDDNTIYSLLELTANETYVISTEKLILDDSDLVIADANIADSVTVTVSSISV